MNEDKIFSLFSFKKTIKQILLRNKTHTFFYSDKYTHMMLGKIVGFYMWYGIGIMKRVFVCFLLYIYNSYN